MQAVLDEDKQRLLDILDFWHKVEFFIPFDVQKQVLDNAEDWQVRWLEMRELLAPSRPLWQIEVPGDRRLYGFELYIGLFDKSAVACFCEQALGQTSASGDQQLEEEARAELEGLTCFARIRISEHGELEQEQLSVSTLPWAMGQVQARGLSSLSHQAFQDAKAELARSLQGFMASRAGKGGGEGPHPLDGEEVAALHRLFCRWAGFEPEQKSPVALVRVLARKHRPDQPEAADGKAREDDAASIADDDVDIADQADDDPAAMAIDILNSFYIQDIERAIGTLRSGGVPAPLLRYLTSLSEEQRIDLYSDTGRAVIVEALHPSRLNRGHWLSDPAHAMSLMQQFAINQVCNGRETGALFSVNGPPGTGKTTLLSDVVANSVVGRACELAKLERSRDAFQERKEKVRFKDTDKDATISLLRPELLGYEMVVVSTNNAAVENISRDLPKFDALGSEWDVDYLRPVAVKLAAEEKDGRLSQANERKNRSWGLIACALGRARNRWHVRQRLMFPPQGETSHQGQQRVKDGRFLTLWEWAKSHKGPGFVQVRDDFRARWDAVEKALAERSEYAHLLATIAGQDEAGFVSQARAQFDAAEDMSRTGQDERAAAERALARAHARQAELREEERLLKLEAPSWLAQLLWTKAGSEHRDRVRRNAQTQRELLAQAGELHRRVIECAQRCEDSERQIRQCRTQLDNARREWARRRQRYVELHQRFAALAIDKRSCALESEEAQIHGLWHDEELAGLRSGLFAAALALHQAWLAEVIVSGGGFGGNVVALSQLLAGKRPLEGSQALPIWQSLFMIVPVVSSTFASFAAQFRDLGPESIGWLFIDEAGQAVPQAAVGALWRARRAVVVGDPRQIEPVFTLPASLIAALAKQSAATTDSGYSPDKVSVQSLADRANRFGALAHWGQDELWIGSPLRVHRRCIDPMFTLANRIAYEDRMILGLPPSQRTRPDGPPFHQASAWIDLPGTAVKRQAVPEQIAFVVQAVTAAYRRSGELPAFYLISPFRAIGDELRKAFQQVDWSAAGGAPPKKALDEWSRMRIGTVHTFQGKEETHVMLVLGADRDNEGAVRWASRKPNLLNVAATRAKHRFYLVGDRTLWGGKPNFSHAREFSSITAQAFLRNIESGG